MRTLNEITADLIKINQLIEDSIDEHGEIQPDVADALSEWFNAAESERAAKYDAYLGLIREKEMREVASKAQEEQWAKKRKSEAKGIEYLKVRLKQSLELTGETKVTTASGRVIAIQNNGGKVPLEIDDEKFNGLGEEVIGDLERQGYLVLQPILDKEAIREGVVLGNALVVSFAKLGERGTSLRIK